MGIGVRTVEKYQPVTSEDPVTADEVNTKLRAIIVLREMIKYNDTGLFSLRLFVEAVQKQATINHIHPTDREAAYEEK